MDYDSIAGKLQLVPSANKRACIELLKLAYNKGWIDIVLAEISKARKQKRNCNNEKSLSEGDINLIPDNQIISYAETVETEPDKKNKFTWCFEKEIIPQLIDKPINPWTKRPLPENFVKKLETEAIIEATPIDDVIEEIFTKETVKFEESEKSKMISALDKIIQKGSQGVEDPYISIGGFLKIDNKYKLLPLNVKTNKDQVKFLYNNRSTTIPIEGIIYNLPYIVVKYAYNEKIIQDTEASDEEKIIPKAMNDLFKPRLISQFDSDSIDSLMSKIIGKTDEEIRKLIEEYRRVDMSIEELYRTILKRAFSAKLYDLADQIIKVGNINQFDAVEIPFDLLQKYRNILGTINFIESIIEGIGSSDADIRRSYIDNITLVLNMLKGYKLPFETIKYLLENNIATYSELSDNIIYTINTIKYLLDHNYMITDALNGLSYLYASDFEELYHTRKEKLFSLLPQIIPFLRRNLETPSPFFSLFIPATDLIFLHKNYKEIRDSIKNVLINHINYNFVKNTPIFRELRLENNYLLKAIMPYLSVDLARQLLFMYYSNYKLTPNSWRAFKKSKLVNKNIEVFVPISIGMKEKENMRHNKPIIKEVLGITITQMRM